MSRQQHRPLWRRLGWAIGALVGLVAGVATAMYAQDAQEEREARDVAARAEAFHAEDRVPEPVDTVRDLVDQEGRVVVDPLLADRLAPADLAAAEQALQASAVPGHLAYLKYPTGLDLGYTNSGVLAQWSNAVGEKGHYVVLFDTGDSQTGALGLEGHYLDAQTRGQPGQALVRIAEEMATWEAQPLPDAPDPPSEFDYWDGTSGGLMAAVAIGGIGVLPLFFVLRAVVGRRRVRQPEAPR